jgi:septum site-determining protein MinC
MIEQAQQMSVKGIREGLLVTAPPDSSFTEMLTQMETELSAKGAFFEGSRVALQIGPRRLSQKEIGQLQRLFTTHNLELWAVLAEDAATRKLVREQDLAIRLAGSNTDLDGNMLEPVQPKPAHPNGTASAANGRHVLLLKETIRSGRSLYHEGDIVIVGDVNAGAEILAAGDVIVWGRLRGLVHAGALGSETAVICALDLSPTQLRIAGHIAISPYEPNRQPQPEIASVKDGQIVAEKWNKQ